MTPTLTLKNLCGYLPYGLKFKYENEFVSPQMRTADLGNLGFLMSNAKPILRKLDLSKPITVNGVEVIPIVALAKIAFPEYKWISYCDMAYYIGEGITAPRKHEFYYGDNSFLSGYTEKRFSYTRVPNQISLFQWLYEHKYDLHGLIDAGMAIDADTLDKNPYE